MTQAAPPLLRRLAFTLRRHLRPAVAGRFQPYPHTLPNRYPWLFDFAAAALVGIAAAPLPDVVLLDIHLGNKSGLTLVHWARKQRHLAHMPIAAVTGLASFKELKSIAEAGCDTCFTKPIDFRALRAYLAGLGVHSVS